MYFFRDIVVGSNTSFEEMEFIEPRVGKQNGLTVVLDQVFNKNKSSFKYSYLLSIIKAKHIK